MSSFFQQILPKAKKTSRAQFRRDAVCAVPNKSGKQFTVGELCAILRNTGQPLKERLIAASLLSGCEAAPSEAVQCLLQTYRSRGEKRELRIAVAISLTNLGLPALAALREIVESDDASQIEVKAAGENCLLCVMVAQALLFAPGGRATLEQIVANPRSPLGWAVAFTVLNASGDPADSLARLMERARDSRFAIPYREAAIYLLGNDLPDFNGPYARQGWDLLVSIQLASSEPQRLRHVAAEVLKLRRS